MNMRLKNNGTNCEKLEENIKDLLYGRVRRKLELIINEINENISSLLKKFICTYKI